MTSYHTLVITYLMYVLEQRLHENYIHTGAYYDFEKYQLTSSIFHFPCPSFASKFKWKIYYHLEKQNSALDCEVTAGKTSWILEQDQRSSFLVHNKRFSV